MLYYIEILYRSFIFNLTYHIIMFTYLSLKLCSKFSISDFKLFICNIEVSFLCLKSNSIFSFSSRIRL